MLIYMSLLMYYEVIYIQRNKVVKKKNASNRFP